MLSSVKRFNNTEIRLADTDAGIHFSAFDVATALKLEHKRQEVNHAVILGKGKIFEKTFGSERAIFVSEDIVIELVMRSSCAIAKEFIKWLLELQREPTLNDNHEFKGITKNHFATTQIAKKFGLSAIELNEILKKQRIQYKVNSQWVVYTEFQDKGYTETVKLSKHGKEDDFVYHTYWTPEGVRFIEDKLLSLGYTFTGDQLSMF
jgi:prophage antirepressor-like protein